jgi:hypothetical protein
MRIYSSRPKSQIFVRLILLLSLLSLLLPIYGSWLDQNLIESQPTHGHVYFGKVNPLRINGHHEEGVVSLPDQDVFGQSPPPFMPPSYHLTVSSAIVSNGLIFVIVDDDLLSQGIVPTPLERPPRS